jgi:2,3-bisphosphoglycerate-independent phosphoglycerate mutase
MKMSAHVFFIVCDGMADRPIEELDGNTPLEFANTPWLDKLSEVGINGIMHTLGTPGIVPGSDTAHLALFGYDPHIYYSGRGAFEALGVGLEVKEGDVALRGNFATVDENLNVLDRRAGRYVPEGDQLASVVNGLKLPEAPDLEVIVKHATQHRCAVILRGPRLSYKVTDTDPHEINEKVKIAKPSDDSEEAQRTADIINSLSGKFHELLKDHPLNIQRQERGDLPGNIIILRGAGQVPNVKSLHQLYGIKSAVISTNALYRGVALSIGMEHHPVSETKGDYRVLANKALELFDNYDLFFIHVKDTDNASHDGNVEEKVKVIERIDGMVGHLFPKVESKQAYICVTADHTTSVKAKDHVGDDVPVVIAGPEVRSDSVKSFSERVCAMGGLNRIRGFDIMPILMSYLEKTPMFGS